MFNLQKDKTKNKNKNKKTDGVIQDNFQDGFKKKRWSRLK